MSRRWKTYYLISNQNFWLVEKNVILFLWHFYTFISSAVFEENVEVLSLPWRRRRAKTLTFSNISVITEDIYLKLRVVVHYQRGTHTSKGGNPPFF